MSEQTIDVPLPQHFAQELVREGLTPELEHRLWETQLLKQAQRQLTETATDVDSAFEVLRGRWHLTPKIEVTADSNLKVGLVVSLCW